jgi:hypothetical protein
MLALLTRYTRGEDTQMAVGIRGKFAGGTQQQYDAIQGHVGVEDDPPEGMIFHSAGPIEGGWGVIDFWEWREAFDRFFESRLRHTIEEVGDQGFPGPPDIKEFPVHNITKP